MSQVPDKVVNKALYRKVKKKADRVFERHGLYKSAWIQKEYKKLGGKYRTSRRTSRRTGLRRWIEGEQWIEVIPYLEKGKVVPCGSSDRKGKACRPLKRATSKTPITIKELIKLHDKPTLLRLARRKRRDMNGRVNWRKATFAPSTKKSRKSRKFKKRSRRSKKRSQRSRRSRKRSRRSTRK